STLVQYSPSTSCMPPGQAPASADAEPSDPAVFSRPASVASASTVPASAGASAPSELTACCWFGRAVGCDEGGGGAGSCTSGGCVQPKIRAPTTHRTVRMLGPLP